MRVVYSASFVIMLVDILTKQPITDAVILCNGKQNPYVTKDEGYYVFCNLYPGNYDIYIAATGYVNKEFSTKIEFGESKKFILELPFESRNPKLLNIPRIEFCIKKDKLALKRTEIVINLKTEIKSMKLIQQINPGDQEILLNIPENNIFTLQRYIYSVPRKYLKEKKEDKNKDKKDKKKSDEESESEEEFEDEDEDQGDRNENESGEKNEKKSKNEDKKKNKTENKESEENNKKENKEEEKNKSENNAESEFITQEMLFLSYDRKYNAYILEKEIPVGIPIGGSFYPYWNLKTDKYGKLVLPFLSKLMTGTELEFEILINNQKKIIKADINKFDIKQKILKLNLNF